MTESRVSHDAHIVGERFEPDVCKYCADEIKKNAPASVAAEGEGLTETPTEYEGERSVMSISDTTTTVEDLGPLRPIYGPSDPRYGELEQWFVDNAQRLLDEDGNPKCEITELTPLERAGWHEMRVLGVMEHDWRRPIEYPDFPKDVMDPPAWAETRGDSEVEGDTDLPVREWRRTLVGGEWPAAIVMDSTWNPDTGAVVSTPPRLSAWVTDDAPAEFTDPEKARAMGRLLLDLADEFERAVL